MIISAFSMCCGYYERIKEGTIRLEDFYKRRFSRVWPYFALLVILDLILSPSKESLYESFANLTLAFGLLPNADISVIGVGWFLGVVFLFYMLFPYFVFLVGNKKRAWLSFFTALFFHYICQIYFFNADHVVSAFSGRINIIYCAVYFLAGGLIYLYRSQLEKCIYKYQWLILCVLIVLIFIYLRTGTSIMTMLPLFSLMLIFSLGEGAIGRLLQSPIARFIGNLSLEIYLSHMVMFRVIEKLHLSVLFHNDVIQYLFVVALDIGLTIIFSISVKWVVKKSKKILEIKHWPKEVED